MKQSHQFIAKLHGRLTRYSFTSIRLPHTKLRNDGHIAHQLTAQKVEGHEDIIN